jgi:hypothetical protein
MSTDLRQYRKILREFLNTANPIDLSYFDPTLKMYRELNPFADIYTDELKKKLSATINVTTGDLIFRHDKHELRIYVYIWQVDLWVEHTKNVYTLASRTKIKHKRGAILRMLDKIVDQRNKTVDLITALLPQPIAEEIIPCMMDEASNMMVEIFS